MNEETPRVSAATLALLSAAALLFLFCESKDLAMNDLGIYLAMGREMVEAGGIADTDHFTHTVDGTRFLNGTWGAQYLFYRIWQVTGYAGLQLLLALAVCGTVVTTALAARRASGNAPAAAGIAGLLSAWLVVQNLGLRPQLFSLPLFAACAAIALAYRPTIRTGAVFTVLVAIWANLHGSFVLAPILAGLAAAGVIWESAPAGSTPLALARHAFLELRRKGEATGLALTSLAGFAAGCLNPYGPGIYRYVAENSSGPASRGLTEWAPTAISTPAGIRLAVAFALVGFFFWRAGRMPNRRDVPPLLAFTFLALTGVRHVVWLGMILPIVATRPFPGRAHVSTELPPSGPVEKPGLHPSFAAITIAFWSLALVGQSPFFKAKSLAGDEEVKARFAKDTPVDLAAWAAANGVRGRVFNSMEWGSYLAWRVPEAKLFVDVLIWIFPQPLWDDFLRISRPTRDWEALLERYQVDWLILDRNFHWSLIPYVQTSANWEQVYADDHGLIFKRAAPKP